MVISKMTDRKQAGEGILYSLPKQLVKISYTRSVIDAKKAEANRKKAQETVDATTAKLTEKEAEEKKLKELIASIDPQAANGPELLAKWNLELTIIVTEKLLLTKQLNEQKDQLLAANNKYVEALQSGETIDEQLTVESQTPIPDTDLTFCAEVQHQGMYSDTLELKTKNGLLEGAIGHSDDKTGEIVVSLAGGLAGLVGFPGRVTTLFKSTEPRPETERCPDERKPISITQIIDPGSETDLAALNKRLGCVVIEIDPQPTSKEKPDLPGGVTPFANGLVYRHPGIFTFKVKKLNKDSETRTIRVNLAQGGAIGILPMPKGSFSKNEYDVAFSNGMLTRSKITQPSEVLGAVMILPNALKEIFSIPGELIKLKVDYSTSEKALVELKKAMIEAQVEIEKKQMELESLADSTAHK